MIMRTPVERTRGQVLERVAAIVLSGGILAGAAETARAEPPAVATQGQMQRLTRQLQAIARQSQQQVDALTQQLKAAQAANDERVSQLNAQIEALQQRVQAQALTA